MSDLQVILIFLGVLIVLGVLLFNWWQEKKFKQKISSQFKQPARDVLVQDRDALKQNEASRSPNDKQQEDSFVEDIQDNTSINIDISTLKNEKPEPFIDLPNEITPNYDVLETAENIEQQTETQQSNFAYAVDEKPIQRDNPSEGAFFNQAHETQELEVPLNTTLDTSFSHSGDMPISVNISDALMLPENLHTQMDLIAVLYASIPIKTSALLPFIAQLNEIHPNFMLMCLDINNNWLDLRHHSMEAVISKVAVSQQLADRSGPVARQVLNRFQHAVETIGLDLNCHVEWQSKTDPANAAAELDQFCMEVDQTIGFHLMSKDNTRFHGTKLRGLAESQGFTLADDGKFYQAGKVADFYIINGDGQTFTSESLKNSTIGKISFLLEIPTAKNSVERFDHMVRVARQFATALDASVVDDATKPLNEIHLEKIRQQLRVIHAKMVARGVVPGSVHALRLFA